MDQLFAVQYSYLIPLLPLAAAIVAGLLGAKWLKGKSHWPIWIGVGASAGISISLIVQMLSLWHGGQENLWAIKDWYTWIQAGTFQATAGFFFDALTAVMLCVVTGIGFLITVFSAGYMKGEEGYFRFFAYLGLFIFAMTCLVMGNNFIMLYLGWEGVGLCSYLLIGYYYERPSAREAAKKAFLVNRVGDFGFGLGIMLIWKVFHTVSYFGSGYGSGTGVLDLARIALADPAHHAAQIEALKIIPFLLMLGAFGKSAQFPLYVWLPDAMEGPTPVSALIHAATMVTAGVYMIARCGTLFVSNEAAMLTIACIGTFTAIFAATIALRQFDLKKVFAYSTISQLGYMFAGVGALAPVGAVFHLVTHAFFKALLFLASGVVMHAMAGELDMRKMSGLKKVLPITDKLMLIGCLALSGCPVFSGFFSKDEIIGATFNYNFILGAVLLIAAFITAYYTFRLYFRVFQGPLVIPPPPPTHGHGHDPINASYADEHAVASTPAVHMGTTPSSGVDKQLAEDPADHGSAVHGGHGHGHDEHHNHEPMIMIIPLVVLAIGALLAGYINWPKAGFGEFLGTSPSFASAYHLAGAHYGPDSHLVVAESWGQTTAVQDQGFTKHNESPFTWLMLISAIACGAGIGLAYLLHLKDRARGEALARALGPITRLLEAKYWVDEIYQVMIVGTLREAGNYFFAFDRFIVDGIVTLVGFVPQFGGFAMKLSTQRGYLQGYAATMLLGIAIILLLVFI